MDQLYVYRPGFRGRSEDRMRIHGDLYKNSTLAIAATGSSSCQDGLFFDRDIRALRPCRISTKVANARRVSRGRDDIHPSGGERVVWRHR